MLTFYFNGVEGLMTEPETLTAGMVGKKIVLEFSPEWEDLSKTVVFSDGENTRDVVFSGNPVTIPAEVLENPLKILSVGVYGLGDGGKLVIPTVRVDGPVVQPGVNPSGDPAVEPENPLWQQALGQMGDLSRLRTLHRSTLVGAINELEARKSVGLYYIPSVTADGRLTWSNNGGAPNPPGANIRGPEGKSAYQYAREAGFQGSEEIFGAMLASGGSGLEPEADDIPKVFFGGALPQSKSDAVMPFRYVSGTQEISGWCKTKAQGNSSMNYPKKNQTVKLYRDASCTEKLKVDFKGWGKQNKFCFKANWIDLTHARNVVSARLWGDVVKSRENYDTIPEPLRTSPNQGAVDGFPVKVYADGIYQGRYTINIPKDAWMANMDDELDNHCILCGENYVSGCFRGDAAIDGSDWTDEVHDTVPVSIKNRWNQILRFVMTSTDDRFREELGLYFDIPSLIDYYLFGLVSCGLDAFGKNQLYMTYDGWKWYATMYDMDSTWGLWWTGQSFVSATYSRNEFQDFKDGSGNLLYVRLENLFHDEIVQRWEVLKSGPLSISSIINRFERFTDIASRELVEEDYAGTTANGSFTGIPSKSTNNIQQIRSFAVERLAWVDSCLGQKILYQLPSEMMFDGTTYIDTGVQLFDEDKPFTLCLDWTHTGESDFAGGSHVIAHAVHEVSPYDGVIVHYQSNGILTEVNQSEKVAIPTSTFMTPEFVRSMRVVIRKDENGNVTIAEAFSDGRTTRKEQTVTYKPVTENLLLGCYQTPTGYKGRFAKGLLSDCTVYGEALSDAKIEAYLSKYAAEDDEPLHPLADGTVTGTRGTAVISGGNHVSVEKKSTGSEVSLALNDISLCTDIGGGNPFRDTAYYTIPAGAEVSVIVKNFRKHGFTTNSSFTLLLKDTEGTEKKLLPGSINGTIGDKTEFGGAITVAEELPVGCFGLYISWNSDVYTVEFDVELYVNGTRYV